MKTFFLKYERGIYIYLEKRNCALLFRFVQFGILLYIGYSMYATEGWNLTEKGIYSVYTNVEGVNPVKKGNVWDAIDFVRPPQEKDSFFIVTRVLITEQKQGECTDIDEGNHCASDWDCVNKRSRNGMNTKECDKSRNICKIFGWCPIADQVSNVTIEHNFTNADQFTVYVRNNVEFMSLRQFRSNDQYLEEKGPCLYHPLDSPLCPIFKIETILKELGINFQEVQEMGGVISFFINWSCYFNGMNDPCSIKYTFKRTAMDNMGRYKGSKYRYANYHTIHESNTRTFVKVYGLRFLIMVISQGSKFNVLVLLKNIGSLLCYLGVWTTISTLLFYYCLNERQKRLCYKMECVKTKDISFIDKSEEMQIQT